MTFFYDMNQRLADLAKSKEQLNEGIKGEIAGGIGGALAGGVMGGPIGATIGGAVGAPLGRKLGGSDDPEKLDEFIGPAIAAGARALIPLLTRVGPALSRAAASAGRAAAPAVKQGAEVAAKGVGQVAKQGAEIAAKNAVPIGVGAGAYSALTDLAKSTSGGVGEVYHDIKDAAAALANKVGDAVDSKTLMDLAGMAVKYAIPIGIVVALLYGGKKIIDKIIIPHYPIKIDYTIKVDSKKEMRYNFVFDRPITKNIEKYIVTYFFPDEETMRKYYIKISEETEGGN